MENINSMDIYGKQLQYGSIWKTITVWICMENIYSVDLDIV